MPTGDNPTRPYLQEERERALTALALCGGSVTRAREMMSNDPAFDRVPQTQVLNKWMRDYQGKYNEIITQVAPEISKRIERDYEQIVVRSNEVHLESLELASQGLDVAGEQDHEARAAKLQQARDASQVAKNIAIAGGVAADKLALAQGRPTSITEHRDPDQILRQIESIAGKWRAIDSTAEEIEPTELASPGG